VREDRELTGTQLAGLVSEELGRVVHPATIWKIETGDRQPSAKLFGAICRSLKVKKSELLVPIDSEATSR